MARQTTTTTTTANAINLSGAKLQAQATLAK